MTTSDDGARFRRQRRARAFAREAAVGTAPGRAIDAAIESATRVVITTAILQQARDMLDERGSTESLHRALVVAFRAAGFEVVDGDSEAT